MGPKLASGRFVSPRTENTWLITAPTDWEQLDLRSHTLLVPHHLFTCGQKRIQFLKLWVYFRILNIFRKLEEGKQSSSPKNL